MSASKLDFQFSFSSQENALSSPGHALVRCSVQTDGTMHFEQYGPIGPGTDWTAICPDSRLFELVPLLEQWKLQGLGPNEVEFESTVHTFLNVAYGNLKFEADSNEQSSYPVLIRRIAEWVYG